MKSTNQLCIILILCIFSYGCAIDVKETNEKAIKFVEPLAAFNRLYDSLKNLDTYSAMSVLIIRPDTTIIWDFGEANDSSLFRVGSISKSFAGLSMLKLVEDGKVSLDDPLSIDNVELKQSALTPELKIINPYSKARPVLLNDLLQASAGFVGFHREDYIPDTNILPIKERVLNNYYSYEVKWRPGEFSSYHNFGPTITAYLVEKISKKSYEEFVEENLFSPMEMNNATFFVNDNVKRNLVNYNDSTYSHIGIRPSGALITSSREFANFLKMLINDGRFNGQQVLKKETIDRFVASTANLASRKLNITEGHAINNWSMYYNGVVYHAHGGIIEPAYSNYYGFSKKYKTAFILMHYGNISKSNIANITQTILPYLQPEIPSLSEKRIDQGIEDEFLGCYKLVTMKRDNQPETFVELKRGEGGDLLIIQNDSIVRKLLPAEQEYIYIDRDPENNSAISGQSRYALLTNDQGEKVIQKISYSHEAFIKNPCIENN